jgi:FkbM family methyltransferase
MENQGRFAPGDLDMGVSRFPAIRIFMEITKKKVANKLRQVFGVHARKSYAQCGEDLLLRSLLNSLEIEKPYYLDIGAHHPRYLSNTYLFYRSGAHGICIEPDPNLFKVIKNSRGRDLCLNVGIGFNSNSQADFYVMTVPTLNTFSKEEAENYHANSPYKIKHVIKLPLITVNSVLEQHAKRVPDLVSLDVEGLDLNILKSFDFNRFRPKLFCVETIHFDNKYKEVKNEDIISLMKENDYIVVADTWLNTIFADRKTWEGRKMG